MKDKLKKPWTSREVHFEVFPKTPEEKRDEFTEALIEEFWDKGWWRPYWPRVRHSITNGGGTYMIGNHPWWVPAWWARRRVVNVAARINVGGSAVYVIERSVLDG